VRQNHLSPDYKDTELDGFRLAPPSAPGPHSPDKGWPGPARVRWFRTFAMNVSQIYDGDGDPVEMKIELEKEAAN
jgi:hypothetical protein